jgi:ectoine hydroxylase-related dioxygenase (phytanoyl-CoA dioxygenase family)
MPTAAIDLSTIASHVREVTAKELAFYRKHGWVKLRKLITPELAAAMLAGAREWHEKNGKQMTEWHPMAAKGVEPFRAFSHSERMCRNGQLLIDRRRLSGVDVPVRIRTDHVVCKNPDRASGRICYHQDTTEHGTDRIGEVQIWIALAECTPEMGTMRFASGVHREGPLGSVFRPGDEDLLARYPKLTELYPLTEPMSYQPGDATVHHGFMIHGSEGNMTERPRLSYILSYTPADSRWWNGSVGNWGSQRAQLADDKNPIVYPAPRPLRQRARRGKRAAVKSRAKTRRSRLRRRSGRAS